METAVTRIVLRTRYPCCGGPVQLPELLRHVKRCPRCGTRWEVAPVANLARSTMTGCEVIGWSWTALHPDGCSGHVSNILSNP